MGCNDKIEAVDVQVTFTSNNLTIDTTKPPITDETSVRVSPFQIKREEARLWPYYGLVNCTSEPHTLDAFFGLLTTSPYAVPFQELGDSTKEDKVIAAIKAQHGLIRAQYISQTWRVRANETGANSTLPNSFASPGQTTDEITYPAIATIYPGQLRVVQDPVSTRILEALVSIVLVLYLAAWWLTPRTDVLAASPTDVKTRLALAANGSLFEFLPADGSSKTEEELSKCFGDHTVFWLGRRKPAEGCEERFGIWALTPQEATQVEMRQQGREKNGDYI